jgi:hypothetical protein
VELVAAGAPVGCGAAAGADVLVAGAAGLLEQAASSGNVAAMAAAPKECFKKRRRDFSNGCMSPWIVGVQ